MKYLSATMKYLSLMEAYLLMRSGGCRDRFSIGAMLNGMPKQVGHEG